MGLVESLTFLQANYEEDTFVKLDKDEIEKLENEKTENQKMLQRFKRVFLFSKL